MHDPNYENWKNINILERFKEHQASKILEDFIDEAQGDSDPDADYAEEYLKSTA